jgi:hypothetical protein
VEVCEKPGPDVKEFGPRSEISNTFIRVPEPRRDVMLLCGVTALGLSRLRA